MKSHVVVTGSYLGRTMNKEYWLSAGDVIYLEMNVLSFEEFLEIFDLREKYNNIDLLYSNQDIKLLDSIKKLYDIYSIIGGYPAVIETFIRTKDLDKALVKIKERINIFCQESLYYFEDINDVKLNSRLYFRDLGVAYYFLNNISASKSDRDGLINETFIFQLFQEWWKVSIQPQLW